MRRWAGVICFLSLILTLELNLFADNQGHKPLADTAKLNTQLKAIQSLIDAREFAAAQKLAREYLSNKKNADYLRGIALCELYLGITHFELTPIDSSFYWLHRSRADFINAGDTKGLISALNRLGLYFRRTDSNDSSRYYYSQAIEKAEKINDSAGLAQAQYGLGMVLVKDGRYTDALDLYHSSLSIREKLADKAGVAAVLNSMGILFWEQGDFSTALDFFYRALPLRIEVNDRLGESYQHNNIGLIYRDLGQYDKALEHFNKSKEIKIQINDRRGLSNSLMNIGSVFLKQAKIDSALIYLEDALSIKQMLMDRGGVANVYRFMGEAYSALKLYDKAKSYMQKAINDYTQLSEPRGIAESKIELATVLFKTGEHAAATETVNQVLALAKKHNMLDLVARSYNTLYQFSLANNDCKNALKNLQLYMAVNDSIAGSDRIKKILATQLRAEYEKVVQQHYDRFNAQIKELDNQKRSRTRLLILIAFAFAILLGLSSGLLYFAYKRKQAMGEIDNQRMAVEVQQQELMEQRDEIERQKNLVIYQRDRIINILTDLGESIEYARKIQQAVLPSDLQMSQYFKDFFVLYMPKETVGGDFYWVGNCSGKVGFAVADCTGHGVPGGFMSMLGISMINDMIANTHKVSPAAILGALRENVITALRQGGHEEDSHDGMDITFCLFDRQTRTLTYAGANMPIIISTNASVATTDRIVRIGDGLIELKPDRMPIAFYERMEKFTDISITLEPGDIVYLFSDGFTDQFGGQMSKKFGYQAFRQLIQSLKHLPLSEQKNTFFQTLEKWKGEAETQTDDILILAVMLT